MGTSESRVCWDWPGPLFSTPVTPTQLRRKLKELGLSQSECARRMYVSVQTVQRWVSGENKVPGPVIALLESWIRQAKAELALQRVRKALEGEKGK